MTARPEDARPLVEELVAERFYAMRPPPAEFAGDADPDVYERRQRELRDALAPRPADVEPGGDPW